MKLESPEKSVTIIGEAINEYTCSIDDIRFAMELLTKHYTQPIQAICQEISSNARDAHREMGKDDVPISIKVPNELDSRWICRDYGTGISPDRMENVFVKYGASTKRNNNVETGGFGIGAKTPWAYSSTFGIETFCPAKVWKDDTGKMHENVMVKRIYLAYIGKDGVGRLRLTHEELTDEPQGTAIIVTAKDSDIFSFVQGTLKSTILWDVRPIITGLTDFEWPEIEMSISSDNFAFIDDVEKLKSDAIVSKYLRAFFSNSWAVIDGIPYPLDLNSLYKEDSYYIELNGKSFTTHNISTVNLLLFFEVGDVVVSTNREQINYDLTDVDIIKNKLALAFNGIETKLQKNIDNCKTFVEAWKYVNTNSLVTLLQMEPLWKKHKLPKHSSITLNPYYWKVKKEPTADGVVPEDDIIKCRRYYVSQKRRNSETINCVSFNAAMNISYRDVDDGAIFVIQDNYGEQIKSPQIWTLLKDDTNKSIFIIDPGNKEQHKSMEEKINYSLFNPIKYSIISPTALPKFTVMKCVNINNSQVKNTLKKYNRDCLVLSDNCKKQEIVNLRTHTGFYVIDYRNKYYLNMHDTNDASNNIVYNLYQHILFNFNIKVYCIKKNDVKYLGDKWVNLTDYLTKQINKYIKILKKKNFKIYEEPTYSSYSYRYIDKIDHFSVKIIDWFNTKSANEQKAFLNEISKEKGNFLNNVLNHIWNYNQIYTNKIFKQILDILQHIVPLVNRSYKGIGISSYLATEHKIQECKFNLSYDTKDKIETDTTMVKLYKCLISCY